MSKSTHYTIANVANYAMRYNHEGANMLSTIVTIKVVLAWHHVLTTILVAVDIRYTFPAELFRRHV